MGALGAADDYLNARTGVGLRRAPEADLADRGRSRGRDLHPAPLQLHRLRAPFIGDVHVEPWLFILIAAIAIVSAINGVNITDGLDGLAAGTLMFSFAAYAIIALLNVPDQRDDLAVLAMIP